MRSLLLLLLSLAAFGRDRAPQPPNAPMLTAEDRRQIRAELERHHHTAWPDAQRGGHTARNRDQQWRAHYDGRGFALTPDAGDWRFGLALLAGRPAAERVEVQRNYVRYFWGGGLEEWYLNDARGLEHGFVVRRPGTELALRVQGGLRPVSHGADLEFVDEAGKARIRYRELKVVDAAGRRLPATLNAEGDVVRIAVDDAGAQYPLWVDPIVQQAFLKASNIGNGDFAGYSVAVDGNTVVVGAPTEASASTGVNAVPDELAPNAGAAYVFTRNGSGVWTQEAWLKPAAVGTTQAEDTFGEAVAISGNTIAVGATGEDSSTSGAANELAPYSGAVYVFVRSGSVWSQQAYLKASNPGTNDVFGRAVALDGNTLVVGSPSEASASLGVNSVPDEAAAGAGAAYVFTRNGSAWSQQAYLKPAAVSTTQEWDGFGTSVAISGDMVVVGAPGEDSSSTGVNSAANEGASGAGAAYVFTRNSGNWTQQAYLKPSAVGTTQSGDAFGSSVAAWGNTVAVGAPAEDGGGQAINAAPDETLSTSGAVYVFVRTGAAWTQQAYVKPFENQADRFLFGSVVSLWGNTLAVGAAGDDSSSTGINSAQNNLANNAGAVFVFTRTISTWTQQAYLKPSAVSASQMADLLGYGVAVSGGVVVAGAPQEDSSSPVGPNELAANSGAAYVFDGVGPAFNTVTIAVPADVQFTLGGTLYTGTQTLALAPGTYSLSTALVQNIGGDTRRIFQSWSDGGAATHDVVVPPWAPVSVTGSYGTQYRLTLSIVNPKPGRTATPASGSFYNAGATVAITASPANEFLFWSGGVIGNPTLPSSTVGMTGPRSITAHF